MIIIGGMLPSLKLFYGMIFFFILGGALLNAAKC